MSRAARHALFSVLAGGLLMLHARLAQAQIAPDSARLAVKLALVRLFSSSYEAEVEYRSAPRLSLALVPRVVWGTPLDYSSPSTPRLAGDRVHGVGLGLSPRVYLANTGTEGSSLAGIYLALKVEYQHLRFLYQKEGWGEDIAPDGLYYYTYRPRDFTETINRTGGAATLGYQCQAFHPRLRLDASLSLNMLNSRSSAGEASRYRAARVDYGYSGMFWSMGLGFGFVVK